MITKQNAHSHWKITLTIRPIFSSLLLSIAFMIQAQSSEHPSNGNLPQLPNVYSGWFYHEVQSTHIFPDQKTFADAVPKYEPALILEKWQMQKDKQGFNLLQFVGANFTLPLENVEYVPLKGQNLRNHINELWPILTRTTHLTSQYDSLLSLPEAYVVPGGRFREIYYWDSYFTMLGLADNGSWNQVQAMIDNFAYLLDKYGHIPNGNRSYYLSRSQPPFFSLMVELLAKHKGDQIYRQYLPQLKREYDYWMTDADKIKAGEASRHVVKLKDGTMLNRYYDAYDIPRSESYMDDIATANRAPERNPAEVYRDLRAAAASGWDFSSRWLTNPNDLSSIITTQIVPVDLNALLFKMEKILAYANHIDKNEEESKRFNQLAVQRQNAINRYLWNDKEGWYTDYNWKKNHIRTQLTAATLFPLYMQAATEEKAERTAKAVAKQLLKEGGLVTTTVNSGQQWDAPNGWAPLQWIAVSGLNHYGKYQLASEIAMRFLNTVQKIYDKKHKLVEKYTVEGKGVGYGSGGEYPLQDGFGWTNGVTLKLMKLYCPKNVICNSVGDITQAQSLLSTVSPPPVS